VEGKGCILLFYYWNAIKGFDIMEIIQVKLKKMATFCYIIGDETTKTCALIDPAFETTRIMSLVKEGAYSVTYVINTHNHSDHTAGNATIISATGAKLVIHEKDAGKLVRMINKTFSRVLGGKGSPVPDILVKDGDIIEIGKTGLKVLHTPGHTPGGICLYSEGNVFTGDTLFVGGVGRTDLPGGSMAQLLKSIHEKIYTLPEATVVWPGHDYGPYSSSTVDQEKRTNMFTN
jgi:hydroxyacylglutathione hydrolase